MIRLITTTIIGLILVTGGLAVYQDAGGGGLDGVLGGLVRHSGPSTSTATPVDATPGVDVPNAAAGLSTPTPPSGPAVSTSAPAVAPVTMTLAQGEAIVAQQGYAPACGPSAPPCVDGGVAVRAAWCDSCPLHVILGYQEHSTYGLTWAFFFTDHYLGTDTASPTLKGGIDIYGRDETTVTLRYSRYRPGDPACCASGGTTDVRFHWDGTRLVPLDYIPDSRSPLGVTAPASAAPAASECAWAVATLREDARLDLAGAATIPDSRDWLTTTAGWWTQIADWITASCVPPWPPQQCTPARTELTTARWVHANVTPGAAFGHSAQFNADWNATWVRNYDRLLALVGRLCA